MQDNELANVNAAKQGELKVRLALKAVLDDAAFQRLTLIKMSNETLYNQIVGYLISLYNSGRGGKVNEEKLKQIASLILAQKKEGTITRLSK